MSVYVDPLRKHPPLHGQEWWCHLIADSEDELHQFAAKLGLRIEWYQGDHYDLLPESRAKALRLGAHEMTSREMARTVCAVRKLRRKENQTG